MQTAHIAIVGAGLSGLYAAYLLERQSIRDYVLLEARDALGGRIASVTASGQTTSDAADAIDRFDLGPTWFWPAYQRELHRLVHDLGLERFEQFETGDIVVERSPDEPPVRMRGYMSNGLASSIPRSNCSGTRLPMRDGSLDVADYGDWMDL